MWVEMLWIPASAGMTKETDGLDKSSPLQHITYFGQTQGLPLLVSYFSSSFLVFHYPLNALR